MGDSISKMIKRFFDYPIKRKPICFFKPEDFTTTGERVVFVGPTGHVAPSIQVTEYEKLMEHFHQRLATIRKRNRNMQTQNTKWSIQQLIQKFPGWNEITVANLHSLFLLFNNDANGMLGVDNFCSILECLGDDHPYETRVRKFEEADDDHDGWINYDIYLSAIYNFNTNSQKKLQGLSRLCYNMAENIKFITKLSVGEQLEYGLF